LKQKTFAQLRCLIQSRSVHVGCVLCLLRDIYLKYSYSTDTGCSVIPVSYLKMLYERFWVKNVNVYLPSLMMKVPDHLYVLGDTYTYKCQNDTHSSNTTCFVTGSMVLYRITPQSTIDHDLVSVVKILQTASPTPSCNKRHHTYGYGTCSKVNARSSGTSSDVTI
jgi:hypothetical protein